MIRKREMIEEIRRKQKEKTEMQEYILAKESLENKERKFFQEEERKEARRIKQVEKAKEYNELIDDIQRNKMKVKWVSK